MTALEVLAANGVHVMVDAAGGYTPTPAVSHAILNFNRAQPAGLADGIVITPSHNPPDDGGFKYNPPHGGPADTDATKWIEQRANKILEDKLREVQRVPYARARSADTTHRHDYVGSLREGPRGGGRSGGHSKRRSENRGRPPGWRERRLLGADPRPLPS